MLLIPIGRENSRIRRHAWVTYAIIAVNTLLYVALNLVAEVRTDYTPIQEKAVEVFSYLADHPWLEVPPSLRNTFRQDLIDSVKAESEKRRPPRAPLAAQQQEKLDAMAVALQEMVRSTPTLRYAYYPDDPSFTSVITAMFIHGDLFHLLGNMLILFVTGPFVEDVFGRPIFAAIFFLGGLVSTWLHVAQAASDLPLVGASGAIAAVMGAYLVRFHRSRIEFFFMPLLFAPRLHYRFHLPAFVVLPFWFAKELLSAIGGTESGVAVWAHVGGFAFGFAAAVVIRVLTIEERFINPAIEQQISWSVSEDYTLAADAFQLGDLATAKKHIAVLLEKNPDDVDARRLLCDVAIESESWAVLGPIAERLLDQYRQRNEPELTRGFLVDMLPHAGNLPIALCARAASELDRMREGEWAIAYYRGIVERSPEDLSGLKALLQILRLEITMGDLREARQTADAATVHPLCSGGFKEALDVQIARLGRAIAALS